MDDLIEDIGIKYHIMEILKTDNFPNSVLFYGTNELSLSKISGLFACAAVCNSKENKPCLECKDCKKAKENFHPDVTHVKLEKGLSSIGVDEIRKIRRDAFIRPNEALRKVYVIENAQAMTRPAQNAILKILEDPPDFVLFILVSLNIKALLETVLSRCQKFFISSKLDVQTEEIKNLSVGLLESFKNKDLSKIFSLVIKISKDKKDFEKSLNFMLKLLEKNDLNLNLESLDNLLDIISKALKHLKQNVYLDLLSANFSLELSKGCYGKIS